MSVISVVSVVLVACSTACSIGDTGDVCCRIAVVIVAIVVVSVVVVQVVLF